MDYTGELASRTISAFPLSIGTSLAFESIFEGRMAPYDPSRSIPEHISIGDYTHMYINVVTLIRNFLGALPREVAVGVSPVVLANGISEEIEIINSILMNEGRDVCKAVYYYSTYAPIHRLKNTHVEIRTAKTDKQKAAEHQLESTLKILFKSGIVAEVTDLIPAEYAERILMLTHHAYDLLAYKSVSKLDLIESHTGKLKGRNLWYTKLHAMGETDLSCIPFHKRMLMVFGDHTLFYPWPFKARQSVVDVAKKGKWTFATTDEKIRVDMNAYMKDIYLRDEILRL